MLLLTAGGAWALSGPKVTVTYSMEQRDGGRYVNAIDGTPLGAGDATSVISIDDDCKGSDPYGTGDALCGATAATNVTDVLTAGEIGAVDPFTGAVPGPLIGSPGDQPQHFTIEYTATAGGVVTAGPVELVGLLFSHTFETAAAGGLVTTLTDNDTELGIGVTGMYNGTDTIVWDGPWSVITTGSTHCAGDPTLCSLGAPPGGWPRIELGVSDPIKNGNPAACPSRPGLTIPAIPTFEIGAGQATVDSNNGTRDFFIDDILTNCDNQAITYTSWYGVEMSRTFTAAGAVPVLGPAAQIVLGGLIAGSGGLAAWRRRSRRA